jgi:hypothetical protein
VADLPSNGQPFARLQQLKYDIAVDIYRQRAREREVVVKSDKIGHLPEWLAYQIFGADKIGSLALAMDPYWQFSLANKICSTGFPTRIAKASRTRRFRTKESQDCVYSLFYKVTTQVNGLMTDGMGHYWIQEFPESTDIYLTATPHLGHQDELNGFIIDTTAKSRNPSVKSVKKARKDGVHLNNQGEYELFVPKLHADWDGYNLADHHTVSTGEAVGNDLHDRIKQNAYYYGGLSSGLVATVDPQDVDNYARDEKEYAKGVMAKNLNTMVSRCLPTRRYFNLGYNLVELKDLPGMIHEALLAWRNIESFLGKDTFKALALGQTSKLSKKQMASIPPSLLAPVKLTPFVDRLAANWYLSFKFGWQSTYQAAIQLVNTPQKACDDVNRLIARNGKFTNLSTSIHYVEEVTSFPHFTFPTSIGSLNIDPDFPLTESATREITLRCMCNVGINFPKIDMPRLRADLFARKIGIPPTPGDLFDLIPWTWLTDWISGAGAYIHLMDTVNSSDSPINYGFMTYKSVTKVTGVRTLKQSTIDTFQDTPSHTSYSENFVHRFPLTGKLEMKYALRLGVDSVANIPQYYGFGLSPDQSAILTALFTKVGGHK